MKSKITATLYLKLVKIIKNSSKNQAAVNDENTHIFDPILFKNWLEIREEAIASNLFEGNETQETLFTKLDLEGIDPEMINRFKRFFVNNNLINAYAENGIASQNVNALEFWIIMQHFVSETQKTITDFFDFAAIVGMMNNECSPAGYVANLFKSIISIYAMMDPPIHEDVAPQALACNYPTIENNSLGVPDVQTQIKRLRKEAKSIFSIGMNAKANHIENALNNAIAEKALDVRQEPHVRVALSEHRHFCLFRRARAIKEIDAILEMENSSLTQW